MDLPLIDGESFQGRATAAKWHPIETNPVANGKSPQIWRLNHPLIEYIRIIMK